MKTLRRKYNKETKGYKIDVFVNGAYLHSTDRYTRCKDAKKRALELYPALKECEVSAHFDKVN